MGHTQKPLTWLVDPEFYEAMQDLVAQGHTIITEDHGYSRATDYDVILSSRAWYCKDVAMLTKYRKIILEQVRKRRYPKDEAPR